MQFTFSCQQKTAYTMPRAFLLNSKKKSKIHVLYQKQDQVEEEEVTDATEGSPTATPTKFTPISDTSTTSKAMLASDFTRLSKSESPKSHSLKESSTSAFVRVRCIDSPEISPVHSNKTDYVQNRNPSLVQGDEKLFWQPFLLNPLLNQPQKEVLSPFQNPFAAMMFNHYAICCRELNQPSLPMLDMPPYCDPRNSMNNYWLHVAKLQESRCNSQLNLHSPDYHYFRDLEQNNDSRKTTPLKPSPSYLTEHCNRHKDTVSKDSKSNQFDEERTLKSTLESEVSSTTNKYHADDLDKKSTPTNENRKNPPEIEKRMISLPANKYPRYSHQKQVNVSISSSTRLVPSLWLPFGARRPKDPSRPSTVKKYKCDICSKSFSRSNTLVTHRRIHTGEKPFDCEVCGRAFRQPGNLTRHRLTHTSHKPYVCAVCNKAFNRASNLHTHVRTHDRERAHVCQLCGLSFHQKVDLRYHSYTHVRDQQI